MACPESRLVQGLVQLAVTNYFAVDLIVMAVVCPLVPKRRPTLRAFDHRPLLSPNVAFFVATTPRCNVIFVVFIGSDVAEIHDGMVSNCISADKNLVVVVPSVNHSVKKLLLGRRSSVSSDWSSFPQDMGTVLKIPDVIAIPEIYLVEII
jgi:hypothetical protein